MEVNVIGVSNAKSKGVKDGIIVDTESQQRLSNLLFLAKKKKQVFQSNQLTLGFQQNLLQVNPTRM